MNNSLLKGLAILQILARSKAPLGVTAVARQLGISKGNVHRMLQALVQTGFVVRHDRGQYGVSIKLWELGSAALTSFDLRQHAADIMDHLVEETGHSAHLSVLDLTEVVYVHKVEGLQSVRAYSQIGGRAPAYCVATGKALLAEQGEQTLRSIAAASFP